MGMSISDLHAYGSHHELPFDGGNGGFLYKRACILTLRARQCCRKLVCLWSRYRPRPPSPPFGSVSIVLHVIRAVRVVPRSVPSWCRLAVAETARRHKQLFPTTRSLGRGLAVVW